MGETCSATFAILCFLHQKAVNAIFRYFRNFNSELGRVLTDTATKESVLFLY